MNQGEGRNEAVMVTKAKLKPFIGKWPIVEMEAWDQEYINMEVPGHFTFNTDGTGHFQFGLVRGETDCRVETEGAKERLEFSWEGREETDAWLGGLPQDEVTALLKLLLAGKGQQAERALKNRFAAWRRGLQAAKIDVHRRTVGEIRKHAEAAERIRHEQGKREQERRETKRRKEREAYLKNLSRDFPKMWKSVHQYAERGTGLAYKDACRLLVDLAEAYSVHETQGTFEQELRGFMAGHLRRKALIKRLVKAGIWNEK